ncbi:MAG: hypothetical protein Q8Q47_04540, partial [Ignavibacteriaceae bacterium]|nr:hypothetical protein [Ignavibacteriaceae bacterium]
MKKVLLFFVLVIITNIATMGQAVISPRLQSALLNTSESEFIKTIVYMRDQVDLISLDEQLYSEKVTMNERAYKVITALQQKAQSTQGQILDFIQQKYEASEIFTYKPLWIVNAIIVEAKKSTIYNLAARIDVEEIDLDAQTFLDHYQVVEVDAVSGIESVEPGLKIINADKLWQLGITGQGRLVMG